MSPVSGDTTTTEVQQPSRTGAGADAEGPFWRRNTALLLAAALLLGVATAITISGISDARTTTAQSDRIEILEQRVRTAQAAKARETDENTLEALGVTTARAKTDTVAINQFLATAFSWSSGEEFEQARETLKRRYGLAEFDDFLMHFLPPSRFNEDSTGERYYWIDSVGLNSEVGDDVEVEVVRVQGTDYHYVVMADLEFSSDFTDTTGQDGNAAMQPVAQRRVLVYLTIDGAGDFHRVRGIPASGTTRHSG
jgi:hypothetical protein